MGAEVQKQKKQLVEQSQNWWKFWERKFKIYNDLFEEVISKDQWFGGLLRKIKSSYEEVIDGN